MTIADKLAAAKAAAHAGGAAGASSPKDGVAVDSSSGHSLGAHVGEARLAGEDPQAHALAGSRPEGAPRAGQENPTNPPARPGAPLPPRVPAPSPSRFPPPTEDQVPKRDPNPAVRSDPNEYPRSPELARSSRTRTVSALDPADLIPKRSSSDEILFKSVKPNLGFVITPEHKQAIRGRFSNHYLLTKDPEIIKYVRANAKAFGVEEVAEDKERQATTAQWRADKEKEESSIHREESERAGRMGAVAQDRRDANTPGKANEGTETRVGATSNEAKLAEANTAVEGTASVSKAEERK